MSRPLAIPVMVVLLILAPASEPASTASPVPSPSAAAIALPHSPTKAMPLANSILSSEPAGGLLYLRVKQRPIESASSIQVTVKNIQVQKAEAPKGLDWVTVIKGEKTFELVGSEQGEGVLGGKTT